MLKLVRAECSNGRTCPNINVHDIDGTLVVQGYATTSDTTVTIPASLVPEVTTDTAHCRLDGGTVHVTGRPVTDPAVLAELNLPDGERAVTLPATALPLPELEETAHAG